MFKALIPFLFLISCSLYGQELTPLDYTWAHNYNIKKDISYGGRKGTKARYLYSGRLGWPGPIFLKKISY